MIPNNKFATKDYPVRCSKLDAIVKCAMRIRMLNNYDDDDEGGSASQNGSLIHIGAAAFHREASSLQHKKKAAWDAIASHAAKFPLHEEAEVRLAITPYMGDPRNIEAEFTLINDEPAIEVKVEFQLPPHELDPTGQMIYVEGTLDQMRCEKGMNRVWDIKSGKKSGWEMVHLHAIQISAYTHGGRSFLNIPDCEIGGFIRTMGYRTRTASGVPSPDGVFFNCPYNYEFGMILLENVRLHVALYRMGYVEFGPGPHCTYCEHGGLGGCSHSYNTLVQLGLL